MLFSLGHMLKPCGLVLWSHWDPWVWKGWKIPAGELLFAVGRRICPSQYSVWLGGPSPSASHWERSQPWKTGSLLISPSAVSVNRELLLVVIGSPTPLLAFLELACKEWLDWGRLWWRHHFNEVRRELAERSPVFDPCCEGLDTWLLYGLKVLTAVCENLNKT